MLGTTVKLAAGFIAIASLHAQSSSIPDWQTAAGGKLAFDVASVKQSDRNKFHPPSFPLDTGDAFRETGGRFSVVFPLSVFITFAYKTWLTQEQIQAMLAPLPKWASTDFFDVEARAEGEPSKDQYRLMMQSLLAERFKLAIHFEQREVPLFALTLAKSGKLGPKLRPHSEGPPCDSPDASRPGGPRQDVFPPSCDVYMLLRTPAGMQRSGSRNTSMALLAPALATFERLGRPVVDRTGLSGSYDFELEWVPELTGAQIVSSDPQPTEPQGPTFLEALRDQLGLKLESGKGPVETLVIDHVERPSEN